MDELAQTDRETQEWLRDLDNFGMPPPQRHLNTAEEIVVNGYDSGDKKKSAVPAEKREITSVNTNSVASRSNGVAKANSNTHKDFVTGDANDPVFLEKVRKFQLINSHPYANKSRIETTKQIAEKGGASAAILTTNNNNKSYFVEPEKQTMTKEEVDQMTGDVRRSNRPVNPYAVNPYAIPTTPSPAPTSRPVSQQQHLHQHQHQNQQQQHQHQNQHHQNQHQQPAATTNGVSHHHLGVLDNGSSSAYSSYSSVGDSTIPAVFSASRAVPSPHEKTPPSENNSALPSPLSTSNHNVKRQFSGFAAAAPNYHANGYDSTRSNSARPGFLSPTESYVSGGKRSASYAPESNVSHARPSTASLDRNMRNGNHPIIEGVFHATPLRIIEADETPADLEDAYNRFERTLSNSLDGERSHLDTGRGPPSPRDGVVDRMPPVTKLCTSYTNTFTASPHRSSVNEPISPAGRKEASSSSSDMTNRSPTISTGSSIGGGGRVPPWRLANQMKPRSNSSLEALETQQRMFERLQDEVEQELASKNRPVYGERGDFSCALKRAFICPFKRMR
uniref:Uncharacterized protein n=1 Tax=Plectus sambesii TaxID=2011161 RepID=A0A914VR91_9BILA